MPAHGIYRSAMKGSLMNSGWRPKGSFIGQINDFWTSVTNVFPQNRTFWRQKKLRAIARVTNLFCFVSRGGQPCTDQQGLATSKQKKMEIGLDL
jgi:hypothetical protein